MNKTIIACTSIITTAVVVMSYWYIKSQERTAIELQTLTETRDRLTVCLDTVMTKSIEAGKPIDAEKAKEICG